MTPRDDAFVRNLIDQARREDLGDGDITTRLLPHAAAAAEFRLLAKQACVFAGLSVGDAVCDAYGVRVHWRPAARDGDRIADVPTELATLEGSLADILAAERVVLNFLQRLCGVATLTRAFVDAVAGTGAVILDTRKTIPGWRSLDKYAVECGGGANHRHGLFDAVLVKDNHLQGVPRARLAGYLFDLLNRLSEQHGAKPAFVEVEASSIDEVGEMLKIVGIDIVLLDNFPTDALRQAVELRDGLGLKGKVMLEASGGVHLGTVRAIAETGVERISVGALTHSAPAIDLSLERVR